MRFSILCTQTAALIKSKWCVLLNCCARLHPNTVLMEAGWRTVPCPATNLSILVRKSSARTKQRVISVALKTPLEIRLGICIYKTSLLHRPHDYIDFTPSWPPKFYNKIAPMVRKATCHFLLRLLRFLRLIGYQYYYVFVGFILVLPGGVLFRHGFTFVILTC